MMFKALFLTTSVLLASLGAYLILIAWPTSSPPEPNPVQPRIVQAIPVDPAPKAPPAPLADPLVPRSVRLIPITVTPPEPPASPPSPPSMPPSAPQASTTVKKFHDRGDICARTGGRKVDIGRRWRCVYAKQR